MPLLVGQIAVGEVKKEVRGKCLREIAVGRKDTAIRCEKSDTQKLFLSE
jgi:hypothetical protein